MVPMILTIFTCSYNANNSFRMIFHITFDAVFLRSPNHETLKHFNNYTFNSSLLHVITNMQSFMEYNGCTL